MHHPVSPVQVGAGRVAPVAEIIGIQRTDRLLGILIAYILKEGGFNLQKRRNLYGNHRIGKPVLRNPSALADLIFLLVICRIVV